jgi:RES domain-containing protein
LFVHLDVPEAADDLVAVPADIPASLRITTAPALHLPVRWRQYPPPAGLADLGTQWIHDVRTAVLAVPSAVIPHELNYLLNPSHPAFVKIRIGTPERFSFDPRMWK